MILINLHDAALRRPRAAKPLRDRRALAWRPQSLGLGRLAKLQRGREQAARDDADQHRRVDAQRLVVRVQVPAPPVVEDLGCRVSVRLGLRCGAAPVVEGLDAAAFDELLALAEDGKVHARLSLPQA